MLLLFTNLDLTVIKLSLIDRASHWDKPMLDRMTELVNLCLSSDQDTPYFSNVVSQGITIEELRAMAPPDYRAHIDMHEARWSITKKEPAFYCSRSWGKCGYKDSALQVCRQAWAHHLEMRPAATCPIQGLLELGQADGEGSGATGSSSSGSKRQRTT